MGSIPGPKFNPMPGGVGIRFVYRLAITENLHFLLFIVSCPIIGRYYFEEFLIHFISSFMLSVMSAFTKKALLLGGQPFVLRTTT